MTKSFVELGFLRDNFGQIVDNKELSAAERVEHASYLARTAAMLSNGGGNVADRAYDHISAASKRNLKL